MPRPWRLLFLFLFLCKKEDFLVLAVSDSHPQTTQATLVLQLGHNARPLTLPSQRRLPWSQPSLSCPAHVIWLESVMTS